MPVSGRPSPVPAPAARRPSLFTFDVFGTVVDWRRGLEEVARAAGVAVAAGDFDRVIDLQGKLEVDGSRSYADITAQSLVDALGMDPAAAARIGAEVGRWPLYPDSREGLRRLMTLAPCVAMTNSDRAHGEQVQEELGFHLSGWISAEDVRLYKPDPGFWRAVAARRGIAPSPAWWHVSAYADYDLDVAAGLGLTTVYVGRPHARPGPATHAVRDLLDLAALAEGGEGARPPE
jgi:2-haloacid dehalogenase